MAAFQDLNSAIKSGEMKKAASAFFSDADDAPFSEIKTAGYLLSVAFKIDGKIPPDKIQQVKDHKKLMKDLSALKESMASGKATSSGDAYQKAQATMQTWLEGVELPPLGDPRYVPA